MSDSTHLETPLQDLRVLVTRARQQAEMLSDQLTGLGAKVVEIPVISIEPPDSWILADNSLHNLSKYDWIIFASANAVNSLLSRCTYLGISHDRLRNNKIGVIGKATAAALEKHGLEANFIPQKFVAETFIEEFPGYPNLKGQKILWPRTNIGRSYITDKLVFAGASLDVIETYKTTSPEDQDEVADRLAKLLISNGIDVIILASGQSVRNLAELAVMGLMREEVNTIGPDAHSKILQRYLNPIIIVTIGPQTSLAAKESLGRVDVEAVEHTSDGVIKALIEHVNGHGRAGEHVEAEHAHEAVAESAATDSEPAPVVDQPLPKADARSKRGAEKKTEPKSKRSDSRSSSGMMRSSLRRGESGSKRQDAKPKTND